MTDTARGLTTNRAQSSPDATSSSWTRTQQGLYPLYLPLLSATKTDRRPRVCTSRQTIYLAVSLSLCLSGVHIYWHSTSSPFDPSMHLFTFELKRYSWWEICCLQKRWWSMPNSSVFMPHICLGVPCNGYSVLDTKVTRCVQDITLLHVIT